VAKCALVLYVQKWKGDEGFSCLEKEYGHVSKFCSFVSLFQIFSSLFLSVGGPECKL
jgi:hypothetical protein